MGHAQQFRRFVNLALQPVFGGLVRSGARQFVDDCLRVRFDALVLLPKVRNNSKPISIHNWLAFGSRLAFPPSDRNLRDASTFARNSSSVGVAKQLIP